MYKVKELKELRFDVFYNGTEYMDHKNLSLLEVDKFLSDCEYMFGEKWERIYYSNVYSDIYLCHCVYTLYKHNYITCFRGEIERDFHGRLHGTSTLLDYVMTSNYRADAEKKRKAWLKRMEKQS